MDQLASRRLADAARDTDDHRVQSMTVPSRESSDCLNCVIDNQLGTIHAAGPVTGDDAQAGSQLSGLCREVVAVVRFAFDRPENVAGPNFARIDAESFE